MEKEFVVLEGGKEGETRIEELKRLIDNTRNELIVNEGLDKRARTILAEKIEEAKAELSQLEGKREEK